MTEGPYLRVSRWSLVVNVGGEGCHLVFFVSKEIGLAVCIAIGDDASFVQSVEGKVCEHAGELANKRSPSQNLEC